MPGLADNGPGSGLSGTLWRRLLAEALSAPPSPNMSMLRPQMPPLGDQIVGETQEGRPIILNPDGSFSTERSTTLQDDAGRWMNMPTIFGAREYPPEDAYRIMKSNRFRDPETGRQSQPYQTLEEALMAAGQRSSNIR